jgi:hypothetical protein
MLNSLSFDSITRLRLGGLHLDYHVFEQNPLPSRMAAAPDVALGEARLSQPWAAGSACWAALSSCRRKPARAWREYWAITTHERLRLLCGLDAIVAGLYGLQYEDVKWCLKACDYPLDTINEKAFRRTLDAKGFWRMDRDKPPEHRQTVLTLVAFRDLQEKIAACGGIEGTTPQSTSPPAAGIGSKEGSGSGKGKLFETQHLPLFDQKK